MSRGVRPPVTTAAEPTNASPSSGDAHPPRGVRVDSRPRRRPPRHRRPPGRRRPPRRASPRPRARRLAPVHRQRVLRADHGARIDEPADVVDDAHVRRRNREEGNRRVTSAPTRGVRGGRRSAPAGAQVARRRRPFRKPGTRSAGRSRRTRVSMSPKASMDSTFHRVHHSRPSASNA